MSIALVLGAGGHPGYPFQVAVLAAIQRRLGIDLAASELIVGTSVGAMTGLLLRAGFSAQDLLDIAYGRPASDRAEHLLHKVLDPPGELPPRLPNWRPPVPLTTGPLAAARLFAGKGRRRHNLPAASANLFPQGRACHEVFGSAADSLFPDKAWPTASTWVVAMRTRDGKRAVFGRDRVPHTIGQAIRATTAIPGWFRPVKFGGEQYVDAGIRSTTNLDLVTSYDKPLDVAIVVPPLAAERATTPVVDAPLRWLVNAQLRDEQAEVTTAGIPTVIARPPAHVVRAMQGSPIRMSPERVRRVLDLTEEWVNAWVDTQLAPTLNAARKSALAGSAVGDSLR